MSESINNKLLLQQWKINDSWTLFLDRDGVVNQRKIGGYITVVDEFEFLPGTLQATASASRVFGKIIVVTNQQGIGKGLMTEEQLKQIHDHMISKVIESAGRIDKVYFSPYLAETNHHTRKPNPGMAMQAARDFPQISFKRSIMLGDSASDMEFARSLGMKTIFIGNPEEMDMSENQFDLCYPSFSDFMKDLNAVLVI
ncbi:Histidine biosynthesis bifunctional protein HisB [bioreactor metagenome]|uniref:D,D-heptose 1,7-bisphosphate phosphatase n=1 Tax=bioreactor metagenome TaxID=1076179 RepID=A0A644W2E1_9ZZZZ